MMILISTLSYSQSEVCLKVDSVYSTSKAKDLNRRDIKFGVKQILEEEISNKYCLSTKGEDLKLDIYYFGTPKKKFRVLGVEKSKHITQVGVKIYYKDLVFEAIGESQVEIRAVMIELREGSLPFNQTVVSSAIKKAIEECVSKMEL